MARKDSLEPALNILHTSLDTREQVSRTFAFTSGDPENVSVPTVADLVRVNARSPRDHRVISVGACLASSPSYPNGNYWFIVALYDFQ